MRLLKHEVAQRSVEDITDRKKPEETLRESENYLEKLRESEEKFRNIFESANDCLIYLDKSGRILDVNRKAVEVFGGSKKELLGKHFTKIDVFSPRDIPTLMSAFAKGLAGKQPTLNVLIKNKRGQEIHLECLGSIMKTKDKPTVMIIARDVTERKEMEEKLRQYSEHLEELVQKRTEELLESEKRYSVLVEEASDVVAILQDEKIVFTNKKAPEILGYSRDEIIGLPYEKLLDEKYRQHVKERYMRILRGETIPTPYEVELIAKTGERVPIEHSSAHIRYQGRPADLIIIRDIRERKRMEEQRLRLEKLAAIGELATMVGHDLRNPLQSIENATYYLNNELTRFPPSVPIPQKTMEMLQVLNDSVNYADRVIRDLQDFSATKRPTLKKTNINAIIKETLSQVEAPKNAKLVTDLGRLPEIEVDKDMIRRCFLNLTLNGIQAMEKGGTLKVSTKKTKDFVEISFKDTGIGISKENVKKIFTPFFTTKAKGMGMGLAICKRFIESHSGIIKVESEEGKGSTFTVKLPIQHDNGGEKH